MTVYTSPQYQEPMPTSTEAGDSMCFRAVWSPSSNTRLLSGDIIRMAQLPAGYAIVDMLLDTAACGTSAAGKAGILDSTTSPTAVSSAVIATGSLATAAIKRLDTVGSTGYAVSTSDQGIGVEVTTSADSGQNIAANAKMALIIRYRPKQKVE